MKRILFCLIFAVAAVTFSAYAVSDNVNIVVNGEKTVLDAFIENRCTYVSVRQFADALCGQQVVWNGENQSAEFCLNGETVLFTANSSITFIGEDACASVNCVVIRDGTMYAPIRIMSMIFGANVIWEAETVTVRFDTEYNLSRAYVSNTNETAAVEQTIFNEKNYTEDDVYWLSRIIFAEAGGESYEGMLAVGNVILNRVASSIYPDTIQEVVFDRTHGVQFTPAFNGTIYNSPSETAVNAAVECLEGKEVVPDCLYFFNPRIAKSFWIVDNCTFVVSIGNHDFYC